MGNRFWTFGGYENPFDNIHLPGPQFKFGSRIPSTQTTIWSTRRQVWIKGPKLKTKSNGKDTNINNYKSMDYVTSFSSVINSTSIIMIGGETVVCFNIATKSLIEYPDFPYILNIDPAIIQIEMVTTTVTIDKNGKRYVFPEMIGRFHFRILN